MRKRTKGKEGRTLADYAVETTPTKVVPADKKPTTIEECFDLLDRGIPHDKKETLSSLTTPNHERHFAVELWIYKLLNNNPHLQKQIKQRYRSAGNPVPSLDDMGYYILSRYRVYLRNS